MNRKITLLILLSIGLIYLFIKQLDVSKPALPPVEDKPHSTGAEGQVNYTPESDSRTSEARPALPASNSGFDVSELNGSVLLSGIVEEVRKYGTRVGLTDDQIEASINFLIQYRFQMGQYEIEIAHVVQSSGVEITVEIPTYLDHAYKIRGELDSALTRIMGEEKFTQFDSLSGEYLDQKFNYFGSANQKIILSNSFENGKPVVIVNYRCEVDQAINPKAKLGEAYSYGLGNSNVSVWPIDDLKKSEFKYIYSKWMSGTKR